jgi:hypothetical protein
MKKVWAVTENNSTFKNGYMIVSFHSKKADAEFEQERLNYANSELREVNAHFILWRVSRHDQWTAFFSTPEGLASHLEYLTDPDGLNAEVLINPNQPERYCAIQNGY